MVDRGDQTALAGKAGGKHPGDAHDRLHYRADIDGLRAVAVLMVVFFHAKMGFRGGYVGVDVFFVISG